MNEQNEEKLTPGGKIALALIIGFTLFAMLLGINDIRQGKHVEPVYENPQDYYFYNHGYNGTE